MKIICPKKLIRRFRGECREAYPNEHFAAIYGLRSDEGNLLITRIAPVPHTSDADGVTIKQNGINSAKMAALRKDQEMIGTIHSHCSSTGDECCWHLSNTDIKSALQWGESVCGIVYVDRGGRRTSVHWYVPTPIPEVIYG